MFVYENVAALNHFIMCLLFSVKTNTFDFEPVSVPTDGRANE